MNGIVLNSSEQRNTRNNVTYPQGANMLSIWVFPKIGVPQNGWFIMKNPMNKWMIWGAHPYFKKHPSIYHEFPCFPQMQESVFIRIFRWIKQRWMKANGPLLKIATVRTWNSDWQPQRISKILKSMSGKTFCIKTLVGWVKYCG